MVQNNTECRRSGLSDFEWCKQNGISKSSFYKAIIRLHDNVVISPSHL